MRRAHQDQVGLGLLGEVMQTMGRRAARNVLHLDAGLFGRRPERTRELRVRVAEMRIPVLPDGIELGNAGEDQLGTGRVGDLPAECERVLRLVRIVISDEDLAVHHGLLWPGYRPAARARSKSLSTPTGI